MRLWQSWLLVWTRRTFELLTCRMRVWLLGSVVQLLHQLLSASCVSSLYVLSLLPLCCCEVRATRRCVC